jgi:hypothetical protein
VISKVTGDQIFEVKWQTQMVIIVNAYPNEPEWSLGIHAAAVTRVTIQSQGLKVVNPAEWLFLMAITLPSNTNSMNQ